VLMSSKLNQLDMQIPFVTFPSSICEYANNVEGYVLTNWSFATCVTLNIFFTYILTYLLTYTLGVSSIQIRLFHLRMSCL